MLKLQMLYCGARQMALQGLIAYYADPVASTLVHACTVKQSSYKLTVNLRSHIKERPAQGHSEVGTKGVLRSLCLFHSAFLMLPRARLLFTSPNILD